MKHSHNETAEGMCSVSEQRTSSIPHRSPFRCCGSGCHFDVLNSPEGGREGGREVYSLHAVQ